MMVNIMVDAMVFTMSKVVAIIMECFMDSVSLGLNIMVLGSMMMLVSV